MISCIHINNCSIIFFLFEGGVSVKWANGYLVLVLLTSMTLYSQDARTKRIAELEKQLQTTTGLKRIRVLNNLSSYFYRSKPGRAVRLGLQSYELADGLGIDKEKARATIILANAYRLLGEIEKPFRYGREALALYRKLGNKRGVLTASTTMGYLYRSIDNYNESLQYLLDALKICEEIGVGNVTKMPIYNQMGTIYMRQNDPGKAMVYFQLSYNIARQLKNRPLVALYLNNIGNAHRELNQYSRALKSLRESQGIYSELEDSFGICAVLTQLGSTYERMNKDVMAEECMLQAVKLAEENNYVSFLIDNLTNIGALYIERKDYKQAGSYLLRALEMARTIGDKTVLEKIFNHLSSLHQATGQYKLAMEYYKEYTSVKNQRIAETKNLQFLELQERYEAEKREKEIGLLKKSSEIQRVTRNVLIAGFLLLAVFLIFIIKKYIYLFAFWKKQKYIGQYRLIRTIGAGGMSTVYLAHGIKDKTESVAVKVLREEYCQRESHRRRFKLEGTIIDKLCHTNIIKIIERGEYRERLFIVMEYIEGSTLDEIIGQRGLPLGECYVLMKQATTALVFIHEKGILHRDLKPENIMVSGEPENYRIKLLDFGLSKMKFQSQITMTGVLVGTANYMAPEQITDLECTAASDIFSLGLIFYRMLTGRAAFQGESVSQIERQIIETTPADLLSLRPEIPWKLNRLVMQMLSKSPDGRPTADEVLVKLTTC